MMEDMGDTTVQTQNPRKVEWNPRCVIFTYFQGDIGTVVDEHFSRALGKVKIPQNQSTPSETVILQNDSNMSANEWCFSPQWTNPQPETTSLANGATNYNLDGFNPMAPVQYPLPPTGDLSTQPNQLWQFSPFNSFSSPEPDYLPAFSAGPPVLEPQPEEKYEPFLNLLQQDRYVNFPQESASWENYNSAQVAGSTGLLVNLPPSSDHYKKIYFSPDRGPASTSLVYEKSYLPETSQDLFY
ncbi:transcription cofactor vestigial-like protein 1 [Erinaceus europaeus]|uniref:Transcription cofactor vestigial-like protein 1 n=1 Tax=Erinaceus europaeus TaxID=9365 RepID=A0A1S3WQM5_ERIEU|nr:transcription cofactor vestigial-like protein 1 [Erinaceus europaeus]